MKTQQSREWRDPLVQKLIRRHRGRSPLEIVSAAAQELLVEGGQETFPIDVEGIASLLGIKRRLGEYPFAGRIYAEPNGQLIMDLSREDSPPRRRFTCGHEITHTVFPGFTREARYRVDVLVGNHTRKRNEEEFLCDIGAAELLLPSALVRESYDVANGLDEVERLSQDANASLEASANRLVDVSADPIVLIVFEVGHKPADRIALRKGLKVPAKLRVRYAKCNKVFSYVPRFKAADAESPYCNALLTNEAVIGECLLPGDRSEQTFFVQAKRYNRSGKNGSIERVLAIARPA